jgi:hypothetical protein
MQLAVLHQLSLRRWYTMKQSKLPAAVRALLKAACIHSALSLQ